MKKFVILIDMDDTIENLVQAWIATLNQKFGTNVEFDDITSWDISKFFPTIPFSEVYAPLKDNEFWKTIKPKQDAITYIEKLIRDGHQCYILTTTPYCTINEKMESLLFKHFPYLSWDNVIIAANKQMIRGDYLIDDGVHNLLDGEYKKILMTMPHNRDFDAKSNDMTRVNSWEEIYNIISKDSGKGE